MAFTVTAVQKDNKKDTIEITIDGSYDDTVEAIDFSITSPDGDIYATRYFPDINPVAPATFPETFELTAEQFSIPSLKFIDGAWAIQGIFDYANPTPTETTTTTFFLFNNNLKNAYLDLYEETVCLGIVANENTTPRRDPIREALEASETFFSLSRFSDVKKVLDCGADLSNELI